MSTSPLSPTQWSAIRHKALEVARKYKPDDPAGAKDLAHRALADVFKPDGPAWTETDPAGLLKRVKSKVWSLAGRDTQRFDPLRGSPGMDDDKLEMPATNWRPGFIPNPEQLLLAKEKQLEGEARYKKLEERLAGDTLVLILLDDDYEGDQAQAEALRRGYTSGEINDARRRLKRHLTNIVAEEEKKR